VTRTFVAVGCTRGSHAELRADVARFFLGTTFAFMHGGGEFRNCNGCGSTMTIAPFCAECGYLTPDDDRLEGPDGKMRHAACAFAATSLLKKTDNNQPKETTR
jgi:hypothetical protein